MLFARQPLTTCQPLSSSMTTFYKYGNTLHAIERQFDRTCNSIPPDLSDPPYCGLWGGGGCQTGPAPLPRWRTFDTDTVILAGAVTEWEVPLRLNGITRSCEQAQFAGWVVLNERSRFHTYCDINASVFTCLTTGNLRFRCLVYHFSAIALIFRYWWSYFVVLFMVDNAINI